MKYYICVESDRIIYIQGRYKKQRKSGGDTRLEVMGWESMGMEPDMAVVLGRLADQYGLEGKKVNLVLGQDLSSRSFSIPKSGRTAMKKMALNELVVAGTNVGDCALAVDIQMKRRMGAVPVMAYYMDKRRLDTYKDILARGRMMCGRVIVLPDCMALMAKTLWKENRVLLIDVEEESVGFYALSGGHCLACRMTSLRAARFCGERADDLLYEELREQAEDLLREKSAAMEEFAPECIVLMTYCLPEPEGAAKYLKDRLGIPCCVRVPDVYDCGGEETGDRGADEGWVLRNTPVSPQCLAACIAGSMDRRKNVLELTPQSYPDGQPGIMRLGAAISGGWALFLAANVMAAAGLSCGSVYVNYRAERQLAAEHESMRDSGYSERGNEARKMDRRIRELSADREEAEAVRAVVSGENVLGIEAFHAFTDAMEPGIKIESMTYERGTHSLRMVVSMDRPEHIPGYVDLVEQSGQFRQVGHSLWEKKTDSMDRERYYTAVYALLGTGGQDEIQ